MQTINSHPSLADLAYASIRAEIVSGRLPGGTRLVEAQLARDLGTSRGPVREALRRLSDDGLANVLPRRGVVVRELTANEIRAISEFRIAIETMAARLCVRRRIPTIGLHGLVAELAAAATDGDEERVIELDFAFHRELCRSSANTYLIGAFNTIDAQIRAFMAIGDASYPNLATLPPEHEAIARSLEGSDEALADATVREHILDGVSILLPAAANAPTDYQ